MRNPLRASAIILPLAVVCVLACVEAASFATVAAETGSVSIAITEVGLVAPEAVGFTAIGAVSGWPGDPGMPSLDDSGGVADDAPADRGMTGLLSSMGGVEEKWNSVYAMPSGVVKMAYLMGPDQARWNVHGVTGYLSQADANLDSGSSWSP